MKGYKETRYKVILRKGGKNILKKVYEKNGFYYFRHLGHMYPVSRYSLIGLNDWED